MRIEFKTLRYKNILSTGNVFTELGLNTHQTSLIQGKNGAGKSTMIDALHFVLFNSAYRNIVKGALVNSINKKELLVEVDFSIGKTEYTVRRGIKPNIFEIIRDGEVLDQLAKATDMQTHLEKDIIKMDSTSFKQLVVMGTASYVPFMQLKTPQRRQIIEELLDIQIIGLLSQALKKDVTDNKNAIVETKSNIQIFSSKITDANDYNNKIKQAESKSREVFDDAIAKSTETIATLETRIEAIRAKIPAIEKALQVQSELEQELHEHKNNKSLLMGQYNQLKKTVDFFLHNENCPTCRQKLGKDAKDIGNEHQEKLNKIVVDIKELENLAEVASAKIQETPDARKARELVNSKVSELNYQIQAENNSINNNKKQIESTNKTFEYIDTATIKSYIDQKCESESSYNQLSKLNEALALLTKAFKDDGVKTMIIRKYIPIINELINRYLSILDFFVEFELNESFEETIKSRFRDSFTYESFSEGEKAKISTAILFTWRHLTKLRNSTSTNLLILDEVFDGSMDSGATNGLMKILKEEAENGGTNSFVISHRSEEDLTDFDRYLKFDKIKNFSTLVE